MLVWSQSSHPRGPSAWLQPDRNGAPPVTGLHLQFGKNAATDNRKLDLVRQVPKRVGGR